MTRTHIDLRSLNKSNIFVICLSKKESDIRYLIFCRNEDEIGNVTNSLVALPLTHVNAKTLLLILALSNYH
jgi:hypothetical protein